ncbi:MAG: TIGR01244 family phosphatase [Salinarimonadaceae bacterium]|nr:MAG: TIGR01244 family phosphatase [Salinarimonadaceae bacterium]
MPFVNLTPDFAVAPQLGLDDLDAAKAAGFRTIVNNRPDGEAPDQPAEAEIARRAAELGLDYRFIPVISGQFGASEVDAFREALDVCEGPVVAFCRSGTRSTFMWAFAMAGEMPGEEIIATAARAGYDLSALRGRI